jgi:DNA mismatch repair protein MutL
MKGIIHVLPPELVAKIAAGEVIERPASVVKELVENSLDAGARHVTVEAEKGGKRLVRVSDDGCGMGREDSIRAFVSHATSKISRLEDLFNISTLGFRGEALASIAAVSRVRLLTRPLDGLEATEVRSEDGKVLDAKAAGRSPGTTVEVRDLFHNVPARRKFLRGDGLETDHILDVMTSYALARPEVGFKVVIDGREALSLHPTDSLGERLAGVYGVQVFRELLPVDGRALEPQASYDGYPGERCAVRGFVSRPVLNKGRPSHLHFFLNGRWFSDKMLVRAVLEAYGELLPPGRYPVGVLDLEIGADRVDVNVHPAKAVVRFADESGVHQAVVAAVRAALSTAASQPHGMPGRPLEQLPFPVKARTGKVDARPVQKTIYGVAALPPSPPPEPEKGLPEVTIIGQAHNLYIVGQTRDGLVVIDQHAACERVNYERLQDEFSGGKVRGQALLAPRTLELSARERRALEAAEQTVERLGFAVEDFGGRSVVVKAVPVVGGKALPPESLRDVIAETLEALGRPSAVSDAAADRLLKLMACHRSIKAGDRMELSEMRDLVAALYRTRNPFSCPHGRPTIIHMTKTELEKKFGRMA